MRAGWEKSLSVTEVPGEILSLIIPFASCAGETLANWSEKWGEWQPPIHLKHSQTLLKNIALLSLPSWLCKHFPTNTFLSSLLFSLKHNSLQRSISEFVHFSYTILQSSLLIHLFNIFKHYSFCSVPSQDILFEGHWKGWALKIKSFWAPPFRGPTPFKWPSKWICPHTQLQQNSCT